MPSPFEKPGEISTGSWRTKLLRRFAEFFGVTLDAKNDTLATTKEQTTKKSTPPL